MIQDLDDFEERSLVSSKQNSGNDDKLDELGRRTGQLLSQVIIRVG